jgi:hypothetical protein
MVKRFAVGSMKRFHDLFEAFGIDVPGKGNAIADPGNKRPEAIGSRQPLPRISRFRLAVGRGLSGLLAGPILEVEETIRRGRNVSFVTRLPPSFAIHKDSLTTKGS